MAAGVAHTGPRPPIATERLSLTQSGHVHYALKTPYRDGTTHVIFEPEDFIAHLAALVPKPRAHLTRYHGVFAPASPDRPRIVPRTRAAAANQASQRGEPSATGSGNKLLQPMVAKTNARSGRLRILGSIRQGTRSRRK